MIGDVVVNALIVIAVAGLLQYLAMAGLRSKATIDSATGEYIFSYVRGLKVLALISLVLPVLWGSLSLYFYRTEKANYLVWLITGLIFAGMSGYALLESFVARLVVSDELITSVSPWRRERTLRWDEIESIQYSKVSQSFVIRGPDQQKIYAPEYLSGMVTLCAEFRKRIPPEKWKPRKDRLF